MPPWDNTLTEEERWHLVNYIRTFGSNDIPTPDHAFDSISFFQT